MMKKWMTVLMAAALLVTTTTAMADSKPSQEVDDATSVLRQFVDIPENAIPSALLRQAYGIAVIPSVLKIGFIFGGRRGSGVISVRTANGHWSNPAFISLTGGSFGFQAGASSTDLILVFKTQRSVDKIANGQFNVGADAAVAAGPVGRSTGASTNLDFNAEVYSYSRSRGLFAGVSLEGARIGIDKEANWLFYDKVGIDTRSILQNGNDSNIPQAGQRFVYTLDRYMPPSGNKFDYGTDTNGGSSSTNSGMQNGSSGGNGTGASDPYGQGQTTPYRGSGGDGVSVQQQSGGSGTVNGSNGNTPPAAGSDYGSGGGGNNGSGSTNGNY